MEGRPLNSKVSEYSWCNKSDVETHGSVRCEFAY